MAPLAARRTFVAAATLLCLAAGATAWRAGPWEDMRWRWQSGSPGARNAATENRAANAYQAATLLGVPPAYSLEQTRLIPMVAREVAAGDFNGDGRDDVAALAVATGASEFDVRLWVQDPDGTLVESSTYRLPGTDGAHAGMAAADLNEDGRDDLIVTHDHQAGFRYLLSQPGGGFAWRVEDWADMPAFGSPRVADLDNDGHLDVVVPLEVIVEVPSARFVTSFGDGAGSFFRHAWTSAEKRESIALGRLDGDAYPDLLAAGNGGFAGNPPAVWWRNDGSGAWLPPATLERAPTGTIGRRSSPT